MHLFDNTLYVLLNNKMFYSLAKQQQLTKALASSFTAGNARILYKAPFTYGRICCSINDDFYNRFNNTLE